MILGGVVLKNGFSNISNLESYPICAGLASQSAVGVPEINAFYLSLKINDSFIFQIGVARESNHIYVRTKYSGVWRNWWKVDTTKIE